ncbi:MAG: alpha/beta fold hydrolase [Proteobacteria bacterium]|nr:alpha/beta fold hydrolase [Pseudomonadota bacterium]MBU1386238.1 alpha/beta fold hydrolase [Pseudomonadota bacterium]MBU1542931.1 alpha/beta fold hydrolase [Pseudomonadota bacterium]MBU2430039.1 alpha/beta fold hydrolase [Pseudomonadota bacterium]MBU2481618.1 alpha/beta fold hydrolase [Pseudomonadota bacterium]
MAPDIEHSEQKTVQANGIEIVYDTFGDPKSPPLILIMGLGRQMIDWDEAFCKKIAGHGLRVIRFDNRDVGLSTHFNDAGAPDLSAVFQAFMKGEKPQVAYTLIDMAKDVTGLMDALNIKSAHIAGASMGGMIAQTICIHFPQRVKTLISIMSTTGNPDLPRATPEAAAVLATPSPSERKANIEHSLKVARIINGTFPVDEQRVRKMAALAFDRMYNPAGFLRQYTSILTSGSRKDQLASIKIPTLVIHGTQDPLIPKEAGADTARTIPGAKLCLIEGMGHSFPLEVWDEVIHQMVSHAKNIEEANNR